MIERKYNRLIEQKAVFARRALARIRFIFQEGAHDEDNIPKLLRIMDASEDKEQILDELSSHIRLSAPYKVYDDDSMYTIREESDSQFNPLTTEKMRLPILCPNLFIPRDSFTHFVIRI